MEDLKNVFISPLPDSPYVKPFRFNYTQNGKEKTWDLLEVHDSVAIVVFNVSRKVMIFVKQFRPAIYYNCIHPDDRKSKVIDTEKYPASLGVALEMCAGIVDKNKPVEQIAQEEVLEECGYNVSLDQLHKITSYRSGVGVQGSLQTFFYCEVTDDMKTEQGGGVDDEIIDVVEKTIPEIEEMVNSPGPIPSPPSCLFALMWFLHYKADKFRKITYKEVPQCIDLIMPMTQKNKFAESTNGFNSTYSQGFDSEEDEYTITAEPEQIIPEKHVGRRIVAIS